MFSSYLSSRHDLCRELVRRLSDRYVYVSVLGKHVTGKRINVTTVSTSIADTREKQCGFVVKVNDGKHYSEYSFTDITEENIDALEESIVRELTLSAHLSAQHVDAEIMKDEPLVQNFVRPTHGRTYSVEEMVAEMTKLRDQIHAASDKVIQAIMMLESYETSSMFLSKNRDLTQNYSWNSMYGIAVAREGSTIQEAMASAAANSIEETFRIMAGKTAETARTAEELLTAGLIEPGVYDIITAPSITGLIAHEAFGHGVEMDMFVKKRAKARKYMNKPVASPLVNMHDGAGVRVPAIPSLETLEAADLTAPAACASAATEQPSPAACTSGTTEQPAPAACTSAATEQPAPAACTSGTTEQPASAACTPEDPSAACSAETPSAALPAYLNDPCIGYFFDDDGVLSHDTQIIKDGILVSGISDAVSAAELGTEPTGNGRRQDPSRKAYTRMTNTYFAPGKDKLEDMIGSIEHGYMLFETSNGMEDPKNWNIQCVACYGREIRNGKFTGKLVAPVVMSGYVPDLLMSISAVSDEWQIIGAGHCGKGYKEWVPVSDGGPYLKARCKLG